MGITSYLVFNQGVGDLLLKTVTKLKIRVVHLFYLLPREQVKTGNPSDLYHLQ